MSEQFLTREQRYANTVYKIVEAHVNKFNDKDKDKAFADKYGSMAHKLPVLIRTAGLAQALAFVEARHSTQDPQYQLLTDLNETLKQVGQLNGSLCEQSRTIPFDEYMRLTEATIEALLWFKRFSSSLLDADITAGGSDD
jgi:CRISPR-associated protein Cmr5